MRSVRPRCVVELGVYRGATTLALADAGVSDFVAPVAWDDSMAQMQVLGWAQGFSSTLGVNLVIANHRGSAESGSGAFASGDALAYTFSRTAGGDSDVRIADLPRNFKGAIQVPDLKEEWGKLITVKK